MTMRSISVASLLICTERLLALNLTVVMSLGWHKSQTCAIIILVENKDHPYIYALLANVRDGAPERGVGDLVRDRRKALGWTQEVLAARMTEGGFAMHQVTVAKLEQARRPIRINELVALSIVLETRVVDLLGMGDLADPIDVSVSTAVARLRGARDELDAVAKSFDKRKDQLDQQIETLSK